MNRGSNTQNDVVATNPTFFILTADCPTMRCVAMSLFEEASITPTRTFKKAKFVITQLYYKLFKSSEKMKKIYTLLFALLCAATMVAQQPNVARNQSVKKAPANAAAFSFSDIQNWTGEGSNVAAMGLKWTGSENTIVFGYRFDGAKTGEDMAIDIVANNPRLFMLVQGETAYGSAIGGFGWDTNDNGFTLKTEDNVVTPDEKGIYYITQGYSFDSYSCASEGDYWNSGWYQGFWSYNLAQGDTPSNMNWASTGCSGRTLTDKSWDLWIYSSMTGAGEWGALVSAPSNQTQTGVEDVQATKTVAGVKYVNLAGQMSETAFSGVNIVVTTYTDGTTSTVKVIK